MKILDGVHLLVDGDATIDTLSKDARQSTGALSKFWSLRERYIYHLRQSEFDQDRHRDAGLCLARARTRGPNVQALTHILDGLLTFESDWSPPLGQPLTDALERGTGDRRLDLGCVAAHGTFGCDATGCYTITPGGKPAAAFLLELIARLQSSATVPMIDVREYAKWLAT